MKQIKNFSGIPEFKASPPLALDKNSSLAFCLKLSFVTQRALKEHDGLSPEGQQACKALQTWSLAACTSHLQNRQSEGEQPEDVPHLAQSMLDSLAQVSEAELGDMDRAILAQHVSTELDALRRGLDGFAPADRAPAALRAAAELVEYAGYAIAQDDDTTKVIPTFLLAQTLLDRVKQISKSEREAG